VRKPPSGVGVEKLIVDVDLKHAAVS